MSGYLVRRIFQSLVFVILSTLISYTVVIYIAGGPASAYSTHSSQMAKLAEQFKNDPNVSNASTLISAIEAEVIQTKEILEDYYEVDKPWPLNYLAWLFDPTETTEVNNDRERVPKGIDISIGDWHLRGSGVLTGDFGRTGGWADRRTGHITRGPTVTSEIGKSWGNSVLVVGLALLFSVLISIPLGIIVSARPGSPVDRVVTVTSSLALSLPIYGLAYVLITVLAIIPYYLRFNLGWDWLPHLPAGGTYTTNPVSQENNPFSHLYHAILPAMTLAIPQIAIISKYVRTSMLEVLGLDYIRTAWAKGLPAWRVLGKHAFRNALLPTITVIGLALPAIASGSIVVEYAFAYQGLGYLTFRAMGGCIPTPDMMCSGFRIDHALLMALLVLLVAVVALANMLADIMYMVADPRVEYGGQKAR